MQKLSTVVFGQKHRLATMAAIANGDGLVNPTDLAIELDFPAQSAVQTPLRDLAEAGLITRQDGMGRVYYRRNAHPIWDAAVELLQAALVDEAATDPVP